MRWSILQSFLIAKVINMNHFMDKLNTIFNLNNHHKKTIGSYFHIMWHGEDIIMALYLSICLHSCFKLPIMYCCEDISLIRMFFHTYISSLCIQSNILHWSRPFSWKISIVHHLRPKCHNYKKYNSQIVHHFFLCDQMCWRGRIVIPSFHLSTNCSCLDIKLLYYNRV